MKLPTRTTALGMASAVLAAVGGSLTNDHSTTISILWVLTLVAIHGVYVVGVQQEKIAEHQYKINTLVDALERKNQEINRLKKRK